MMARGWAQFHRDLALAMGHEGVVADMRYNRGGHTSQLIIEKLRARIIGYDLSRHAANETYPADGRRGPLVLVANQFSGSDGDMVNAAAQELGLGPVVGQRTWGGVVGIDGRFDLVDGTAVTQPRYGRRQGIAAAGRVAGVPAADDAAAARPPRGVNPTRDQAAPAGPHQT